MPRAVFYFLANVTGTHMKASLPSGHLRILCISPLFTPTADSEAFCAAKMVQALIQNGAEVSVLASRNFRERPTDSSILWKSLDKVTVDVPVRPSQNRLHSIFPAAQFQTPFDARWVSSAYHIAQSLHHERQFDLIYSRSLPIAAHIVGFWCAKRFNLPWIANINDPWTSEFFPVDDSPQLSAFWTVANIFWLRRTIRNAAIVTYPCRRLKDFHSRIAKLEQVAEVIPHIGLTIKPAKHKASAQFRLVHAGKLLASEGRFGKYLLLGFKAFLDKFGEAAADAKLVLVGPGDKETQSLIYEMGLQQNIEVVGRVNYEDSLQYIAGASVCVLIESRVDEGIFLASKLVDYLALGKPVLAISPKIGTAEDLAQHGELIRVEHSQEAVRDGIATLYAAFKCGRLESRNPSEKLQTQLKGSTIAEKFLSKCRARAAARSHGRAAQRERAQDREPLFDPLS